MIDPCDPQVAIIIPVFKHPVLVTEAITCAIAEVCDNNGVVVIVNDGCPYPETHDVCLTFCQGMPERVFYIKTSNGGLSAARNRGIRHAFSLYPNLSSIYLLDADNRLAPGAMRRSLKTLADSGADWAYPSIDKFGVEWSGDFSGPYSVLRHLFQNICEAGSLVHRRVFDAGVFFDENMLQGYEDWEFWLQALDAGFRGVSCPDFGFRYRSRRESMVRNSDRDGLSIVASIQRKHKRLYGVNNLLQLEHVEAPRYCVVDSVQNVFIKTSIADIKEASFDLTDLARQFWLHDLYPSHCHFPNFLIFCDGRLLSDLVGIRLSKWIFWEIEDLLSSHAFCFINIRHSPDRVRLLTRTELSIDELIDEGVHIVAVQRKLFRECLLDTETIWIDSIRTKLPSPSIGMAVLEAPISASNLSRYGSRHAIESLFYVFQATRSSPFKRQVNDIWDWREQGAVIPSSDLFERVRSHLFAQGALVASTYEKHEIVFVAPLMSFGGVEQVGMMVASAFKAAGWRTRLVVTESNEIREPRRLFAIFDTICLLNDSSYSGWQPSGLRYFGHELQSWPISGRHDRLNGLIAGCSAMMLLQASHGYEVMGWLRRLGTVMINSLHLIDKDILGAPVGHPYLTLAYEHAVDFITVPSKKLLAFCGAAGVPNEKLVYLANAPTFEVSKKIIGRRLQDAEHCLHAGIGESRLKVLSMGRLDRQKGGERLVALVKAVRAAEIGIDWRFVGGKIVGDGDISMNDLVFEPPVYDRASVIERLLWADVVVLLSHWEGSPLLILEAQSLGTIPIATNVGAVSEMIRDGIDGFLVENSSVSEIVARVMREFVRLVENPKLRFNISRSACARLAGINWKVSSADLIEKTEGLLNARECAQKS